MHCFRVWQFSKSVLNFCCRFHPNRHQISSRTERWPRLDSLSADSKMVSKRLLHAVLLGLLVFLATSQYAGAAGLDKDGDGEVSAEEFLAGGNGEETKQGECRPGPEANAQPQDAGDGPSAAELQAAKAAIDDAYSKGLPVELSRTNAPIILDGSMNVMLKFSTSWCGHCVKMQPDWDKLAKTVHQDFTGCRIVSVDCEKEAEVCQAFEVKGYPTIMLLKTSKTPQGEIGYQPVPYQMAREFRAMLGFLRSNQACKSKNLLKTAFTYVMSFVTQIFKIEVSMPK